MFEVLAGLFGIMAGCFALWTGRDEVTFKRWGREKPRRGWSLDQERAGALLAGAAFIFIGTLILIMGVKKLLSP